MGSDWDRRKAVQRMQEYIEDHLQTPITMHGLSQAARYSMFYAARIFKEITGRSPYEYIRLRRLSEAALQLNSRKAHVIDVALILFLILTKASHEHLSGSSEWRHRVSGIPHGLQLCSSQD